MKKRSAPAVSVPARVKAYLETEMASAIRQLETSPTGKGGSPVHEARKSIKKLRAALRLAVRMFSETARRRVESPLRAAAHLLGPLRDHEVLKTTVRELRKRGEPAPAQAVAPASRVPVRRTREALQKAAQALRDLAWDQAAGPAWKAGLNRLYQRCRKAMQQAEKSGSDENLHRWRRRAKDFYYALAAVGPEEIPGGAKMLKKTDALTKYLGEDHDLAVFGQQYAGRRQREKLKAMFRRAKKRRRRLQAKAFAVGKNLFGRRGNGLKVTLG